MRVSAVLPAGSWDAAREVDQVLIDYDRRFRRRILLTTVSGAEVFIDLPQAVRLRDGDGLDVEGCIVRVRAQAEACMDIHAHGDGELVRIAWHLGNRHLPVQLLGDVIRIRADHVIGEMIEGLGGHVDRVDAPFDPEAGAYSGGGHHHHHGDDDDHHHG
jgi:urease accessory protein